MRKFKTDDYTVYEILGETLYAVIRNAHSTFPSPNYVTIQTLYSFYGKYDDVEVGLSPESELEIMYIKGIVPPHLSKKDIFEQYPEYMI